MLARHSGEEPESLAVATARTLASFAHDPAGLLVACRRLVAHHPDTAPMWWLAARILATANPAREAAACAYELETDPTPRHLADALSSMRPTEPLRRVAEVVACDGTRVAFTSDGADELDGVPPASDAWIIVRLGRHLPSALFDALVCSSTHERIEMNVRTLGEADVVVGTRGVGSPDLALGGLQCGAPPELLRAVT